MIGRMPLCFHTWTRETKQPWWLREWSTLQTEVRNHKLVFALVSHNFRFICFIFSSKMSCNNLKHLFRHLHLLIQGGTIILPLLVEQLLNEHFLNKNESCTALLIYESVKLTFVKADTLCLQWDNCWVCADWLWANSPNGRQSCVSLLKPGV